MVNFPPNMTMQRTNFWDGDFKEWVSTKDFGAWLHVEKRMVTSFFFTRQGLVLTKSCRWSSKFWWFWINKWEGREAQNLTKILEEKIDWKWQCWRKSISLRRCWQKYILASFNEEATSWRGDGNLKTNYHICRQIKLSCYSNCILS